MPLTPREQAAAQLLADPARFSRACYPGQALRGYQRRAMARLQGALARDAGAPGVPGPLVLLMARQAGKDEMLAQALAWLLARYRRAGAAVVFVTPTLDPQGLIALRRLQARLVPGLHPGAKVRDGHRVVCGAAAVTFLSAHPAANARGETAGRALIANEAQDIDPDRWDAVFAPMAASTNAPGIFAGTPWLAGSLLSRQTARAAEAGTLVRVPWEEVAAELPAYGAHVAARRAEIGATHPFFLSEYCLIEPEDAGALFPAARQALMRGSHARQDAATPGREYALLLDVGGGDEDALARRDAGGPPSTHDSTALTVVEIDRSRLADAAQAAPGYRVVTRYEWRGEPHTVLLSCLVGLARETWRARWLVGDATGLGHGLLDFLSTALHGHTQVIPFVFSASSKSALGWAFLTTILTGRYAEYVDDGAPDTRAFWAQVAACRFTVAAGPDKALRWGVPPRLGHDDLLISAALVAALDDQDWRPRVARGYRRG